MSAIDRQQAVIDAIRLALQSDAALGAHIGDRLYDAPPGRAELPEITIRLVSGADDSTADTEAQKLLFDLDVWDRYELGADLSATRMLMGHIRRILHMQALTVAGADLIALRCTGAQGPFRDPDNVAVHGVVTVAALAGHEAVFD